MDGRIESDSSIAAKGTSSMSDGERIRGDYPGLIRL
jgi:hypothetical protein